MAEIKFSQLTTAAQLTNDDIFALAQMQGGSLSSVKTSMIAVANFLNTQVQYTTAYNTQAKTTAGAINELKQLISLIPQFAIEVVEELPTEDISDTTIYLVPAEDPEVGNYYEEYIHVNDSWELVGTTAVDLSAYYTKLEVDGLLATKASVAEVALKENKTDMPTDVRTIIKDCKTPKNATITNGIAQFECIEENLVKGLKVTMNPIQDLHGYDNPWVGGAGKNKLPMTVANIKAENTAGTWSGNVYTLFGVDFTVQTDGDENVIGIKAYGTSTRQINFVLKTNLNILNTDLILNGTPSGLSGVSALYAKTTQTYYDNGSGVSFNSGSGIVETIIVVNNGKTIDAVYKPMIRLSTETDATYAPYSNICPISGRTEASVKRIGANQWDEQWESGSINNTTGENINAGTNRIRSKNYIPVFPQNSYYFYNSSGVKCFIYYYKADQTFIGMATGDSGLSNVAFTTPAECYFVRFRSNDNYGTTYGNNIAINYPSTDTEYHAYQGHTYTSTFGQTVYGGNYDFASGNGSETIVIADLGNFLYTKDTSLGVTVFRATITNRKVGYLTDNYKCSQYKTITGGRAELINNDNAICAWNANSGTFAIRDSSKGELTNVEFQAEMSGVQLCYELATPTTISTSAEEITTVSGTNIISGTEPISECKYTELATVDDLRKIIGGQ